MNSELKLLAIKDKIAEHDHSLLSENTGKLMELD